MATQTGTIVHRTASESPQGPWERPEVGVRRRPRRAGRVGPRTAVTLGVVILALGALAARSPTGSRPAVARSEAETAATAVSLSATTVAGVGPEQCPTMCEFSSAGSADLHAFHYGDAAVLHALYLEARWTRPALRKLQNRVEAWRQTMTVELPEATDPNAVRVYHWASDLPGARVDTVTVTADAVTFTVTTGRPTKLRAGRLYRTQLLIQAHRDLDGSIWHYSEEIDRRDLDGETEQSVVDQSSAPRRGTAGWCPRCYVEWGQRQGSIARTGHPSG